MGAGRFWVHVVETFSQLYLRQATRAHCVTAACRLGMRGPRQGHSAQCTAAAGLRAPLGGSQPPLRSRPVHHPRGLLLQSPRTALLRAHHRPLRHVINPLLPARASADTRPSQRQPPIRPLKLAPPNRPSRSCCTRAPLDLDRVLDGLPLRPHLQFVSWAGLYAHHLLPVKPRAGMESAGGARPAGEPEPPPDAAEEQPAASVEPAAVKEEAQEGDEERPNGPPPPAVQRLQAGLGAVGSPVFLPLLPVSRSVPQMRGLRPCQRATAPARPPPAAHQPARPPQQVEPSPSTSMLGPLPVPLGGFQQPPGGARAPAPPYTAGAAEDGYFYPWAYPKNYIAPSRNRQVCETAARAPPATAQARARLALLRGCQRRLPLTPPPTHCCTCRPARGRRSAARRRTARRVCQPARGLSPACGTAGLLATFLRPLQQKLLP